MKKIKEVIIVEGKDDISAVKRAVDAEIISVNGYSVKKNLKKIEKAYKNNGIIILTDPDYGGIKIRKVLSDYFPNAKQAYLNRSEGLKNKNIGIENAKPESIIKALEKSKYEFFDSQETFKTSDLIKYNLIGKANSKILREKLGEKLEFGYSNGKQLLSKLNHYNISKEELENIINEILKNL